MSVAAMLVVLAVGLVTLQAVDRSRRRWARWQAVRDARAARLTEDICWDMCRQEAYRAAIELTFRRGDLRLLRDLGVVRVTA